MRYIQVGESFWKSRDNWFFWVVSVITALVIIVVLLSGKSVMPAPEVRPSEEYLTVALRDTVILNAFENSSWCKVTNRLFGNMKLTKIGEDSKYEEIFEKDSVAWESAKEFPHLFEYGQSKKGKYFEMKVNHGAVTMPTWLVVRLIENDVLVLPGEEKAVQEM